MSDLSEDRILEFVSSCLGQQRVRWIYHVNMRLKGRFIPREWILESVGNIEVVETYPHDKYLPTCLLLGRYHESVFHFLVAMDFEADSITIVTAYRPDPARWDHDWETRRKP